MGLRVTDDEVKRWEAAGLIPPRPSDRARQDRYAALCGPKAAAIVGRRAFVEIPPPNGVNAAYCNVPGKGRVKTKRYREWESVAAPMLIGLAVPPMPVTVRLTITEGQGWRRTRDLDGVVKQVLDLLVSRGYLPDDRCEYVRRVTVELDPSPPGPRTPAVCRVQLIQWSAGG